MSTPVSLPTPIPPPEVTSYCIDIDKTECGQLINPRIEWTEGSPDPKNHGITLHFSKGTVHPLQQTHLDEIVTGKESIGFRYQGDLWAVATPFDAGFNMRNAGEVEFRFTPENYHRVPPDNRSYTESRLFTDSPYPSTKLELAAALEWIRENEEIRGLNDGVGTLQGIIGQVAGVLSGNLGHPPKKEVEGPDAWPLTNRERRIVATTIQWLMTNCGRDFLHRVEKRAGEKIVP